MQPIHVGLVGAGGIATRHAAAYRKLQPRIRLSAVADVLPGRAEELARNCAADVYVDYSRMLSDAEIDAVDICLPHQLHAPAVLAAVRAGKHVLCEKPLCTTAADAATIATEVAASGVTVMCMHNRLYSPVLTHVRELLRRGELGTRYEVRASDCFRNPADAADLGWRTSVAACGGGELIDTGYHPVYLVLALAGGRPTDVLAMTSRHRMSFLEGEDSAQLLVRFDNGVQGHVATSWAYDSDEHFAVAGELGTLRATRTRLTHRRPGGQPVVTEFAKGNDIEAAVEHFADCLATGARPLSTHEDGATALAVILAAYDSVRTRAVINLADRRVAVP
ncbi:MAG TPA: Gfo/Idh/MocA family oxidoreductase [Pseudonocardiaceae bacterium]|jgi:predicted dehydrogenase